MDQVVMQEGLATAGLESSIHKVAEQAPCLTLDACTDLQEVRKGRYSVIYKASCQHVGDHVAIKSYDRPSLLPKKQKMATREAIVMRYLNSQGVPNITHMWSAYASRDQFHIIMEFCERGNLLELLKAAAVPSSEDWLASMIAAPLLRTLSVMHTVGVTHRDVKLENIFLDAAGHPKLGDFDLAVFHHEGPARAPVGTIFYMAPEVLLLASYKGSPMDLVMQRRVCEKMDVWSLGVCLFELAAGYKPFQGESYESIASAVIQHSVAELPSHISPALRSFLVAALTYDPVVRPSAQQLLSHPWIQVHAPMASRSDSAGSLMENSSSQQHKLAAGHGKRSSSCGSSASAGKSAGTAAAAMAAIHAHVGKPIPCSSTCGSSADSMPGTGSHSSGTCQSNVGCCSSSSSSCLSKCGREVCGAGGDPAVAAAICSTGSAFLGSLQEHLPPQQPHHHRASSAASSCSRLSTLSVWDLQWAGSRAAAVGPAVANSWALQQHHHQPCVGSCGGLMPPLMAQAVAAPVLRNRGSLGTHHDWSTQDSVSCQSPRSLMRGMGLSSSNSLCRHLLPWASAGSSGLGLNTLNSVTATSAGACATGGHSQGSSDTGALAGLASDSSSKQRQQVDQQQQGHHLPGSLCNTATNHEPQQQHLPMKANEPPVALGGPAPAPAGDPGPAGGPGSSRSSQQQALLQQQQQQPGSTSTGGITHNRSRSGGGAGGGRVGGVPSAPAAVPPPHQQQQVSPLALAVAAAVAEHNKRQPRMWTPFALRVHQLRVAQVLLAERQRQVDLNQPTPPPPLQPLMPVQPTRLPVLQDDEEEAEQQQQQPTAVAMPNHESAPKSMMHHFTREVAVPTAARTGVPLAAAQAKLAALRVAAAPEQQPPLQQAMPAAQATQAVTVQSPQVHEMQQRLPPLTAHPHTTGGGSSSSGGGGSRTESPAAAAAVAAAAAADSRPTKAPKKKWLACIAPRAL